MRKLFAVLFTLALACSAWAQNGTTLVRGVVTDPTGALVSTATVTLTDDASKANRTAKVNKSGEYAFEQVNPSHYTITATAEGFGTLSKQTELLVNQPATVNFALPVSGSTETVEVTAKEMLNFTDASIGNSINNEEIAATPTDSRNVTDLLSLQPGVTFFNNNESASNPYAVSDSRVGAVAGARSDQSNVTLDGLDDNDQINGYAFSGVLRPTQDSTEEYRVVTAGANSDAGRSSGAQLTLVTKSGTNHMHGSLYEYARNRFFDANDWFPKQTEFNNHLPNKPPQLTRHTFGGTIDGPILKDKLFYFFNYEGQRTHESSTVTQEVPTASYAAGNLSYLGTDGANHTLTSAQVAQLDAPCTANGVCPNGPGPDAAILAYFAQVPTATGYTVGDGLNEGSYTFSSPVPYSHNTSILKLDWNIGSHHHVFVRGNLQKDIANASQQFPGLPASTKTEDNSKGISAGDTWTITPNMVNDIRYGYIRQGTGTSGLGHGSYTDVRFIATPTAETRNTIRNVPVNEITDNLSWTKGRHSLSFGGVWKLIHNNTSTDANSWDSGTTNPQGLSGAGLPNPSSLGNNQPGYATSFKSNWLNAYGNLVGAQSSLTRNINYFVNPGGATGSLLAQGAYVVRHFKSNEFEYYVQDSWRATTKLTLTFGIHHTLLGVPYDTTGQSAAPTIDTDAFFKQRQISASQGVVYEPTLLFAPNGPVYGQPGYWTRGNANVAPRFAFAYAVNSKTSIRGSYGMFYDHFGQGIVNAFNQSGSFGLASKITSPLGQLSVEAAPRFTSRTTLPNLPVAAGSQTQVFPYAPPANNFSISWGVDNKLKTPYSQVFSLSVQRSLPAGFTFEADYLGRVGRRLLQQTDLATPTNFYDTKSGTAYFQAAAQLSAITDANGASNKATVQNIPFFENLFPYMANISTTTCPNPNKSATQAIYCNEWTTYRSVLGETTALADIDFYCSGAVAYGCSTSGSRFWQNQFSSLYSFTSNGSSSYNAAQFILRHPYSHGLQMDFSYTYGKSMDMGSDAERANFVQGGSGSYITNAWIPAQTRAVSDFDNHHNMNFNGSYILPFGHGREFLNHGGKMTELLVGGLRLSSLSRWSSGFPFSIGEGGYTTDWEIGSYSIAVAPLKANTQWSAKGVPNAFGTRNTAIVSSTSTGGPYIRLPYPGEAGMRNAYRGDGYYDTDASLSKPFSITEKQKVVFAWEVFNITNSVRFNTKNLSTTPTSSSFGNYSGTLTTSRRQQFSLRYSF